MSYYDRIAHVAAGLIARRRRRAADAGVWYQRMEFWDLYGYAQAHIAETDEQRRRGRP